MTDKKGAIPLDQREAPKPAEVVNGPKTDDDVKHMMKQMLSYLYTQADKGNLKSISVVFVDDSDVPQHAFFVQPNGAAVLLGGLFVASDQMKQPLLQQMEQHRLRLVKEAQEREKDKLKDTTALTPAGKAN